MRRQLIAIICLLYSLFFFAAATSSWSALTRRYRETEAGVAKCMSSRAYELEHEMQCAMYRSQRVDSFFADWMSSTIQNTRWCVIKDCSAFSYVEWTVFSFLTYALRALIY